MSTTHTRTYVILEVSPAAFAEIDKKLRDAGYDHVFSRDEGKLTIDMHGIALQSGNILICDRDPRLQTVDNPEGQIDLAAPGNLLPQRAQG